METKLRIEQSMRWKSSLSSSRPIRHIRFCDSARKIPKYWESSMINRRTLSGLGSGCALPVPAAASGSRRAMAGGWSDPARRRPGRAAAMPMSWRAFSLKRWNPCSASASWSRITAPPPACAPPEDVSKAEPDGYTLLVGTSSQLVHNIALFDPLPVDIESTLRGVAMINEVPMVMCVPKDSPDTDLAGLTERVSGRSGRLPVRLRPDGHHDAYYRGPFPCNASAPRTWSISPIRAARRPWWI